MTALLRPSQPQQPLSPTLEKTTDSRGELNTYNKKRQNSELFSVPSLQREQLEAWDLLMEPNFQLFLGCLHCPGKGQGEGAQAGLGGPRAPPAAPGAHPKGGMRAVTSRKGCLSPVCVSRAQQGCPRCGVSQVWGAGQVRFCPAGLRGHGAGAHRDPGAASWPRSPAGEGLPGEPGTSVSSLSGPSTEQRAQQQKKMQNAFKNTLSFPFLPEAEVLK